MELENPKLVENILLEKINTVQAGLLRAYPDNDLKSHLQSGSCYDGDGQVESFLSFRPSGASGKESIDLTFGVACTARGAIFSSEIAWSDGKVIDEVVVCEVCPECFDELGPKIDKVMVRIQDPLIERIVELLDNFS